MTITGASKINTAVASNPSSSVQDPANVNNLYKSGAVNDHSGQSTATHVSALAKQLNEVAGLAEQRDSSLSRDELGKKALSVGENLGGMSYVENKERYDAEVPKTDDPILLARAKQATTFVNGKGDNPFKGMSRDQLALITYAENGPFTVNERKAASLEAYEQESTWRKQVVAKAIDAYNRTGSIFGDGVGQELLAHYESLPAIEQSTYPKNYKAQLKTQITQAGEQVGNQNSSPYGYASLLKSWSVASPEKGLSDLTNAMTTGANADMPSGDNSTLAQPLSKTMEPFTSTPEAASGAAQLLPATRKMAGMDAASTQWDQMSQQQLKVEAKRILAPLNALTNDAAIARADQEVPDTSDQKLLDRAKQATAFFKKNASNPFAGLPREKLTSIIYDDSGSYTTNERVAAMSEQQNQDFKYWSAVFADSASRGDRRKTYMAAIDFYEKLSPLERAYDDYPSGYELLIQSRLKDEEKNRFGESLKDDAASIFLSRLQLAQTSKFATGQKPSSQDQFLDDYFRE